MLYVIEDIWTNCCSYYYRYRYWNLISCYSHYSMYMYWNLTICYSYYSRYGHSNLANCYSFYSRYRYWNLLDMYFCCSAGIHYVCNCVEVQAIYAQINNLYKSCLFLKTTTWWRQQWDRWILRHRWTLFGRENIESKTIKLIPICLYMNTFCRG